MKIPGIRLALLLVGVLLFSGCSEILPGLNIRTPSAGHDDYRIVKDASGKYGVEEIHPQERHDNYRLMPITAKLIAAEAQANQQNINASLPPLLPSAVAPEYQIGPGDVLGIVTLNHPELSAGGNVLSVNPATSGTLVASDGTIYYPYLGTFKAEGMTTGQLRDYITSHLSAYIRQPQVEVRVISYQADRVEVTGEVAKPGTITLDNTAKGVLQAIDLSGGLTPAASRRRVILIRGGKRYDLDLAGLLSGDRIVPNPALEPGDEIHVPDQSSDQVFMLGAVNTQKPIVLQQDSTTLLQALTEAGGLDVTRANDSGVLVFRLSTYKGELPTVFTLDLSQATSVFLAGQFHLQPRDVVYVKATAFSQYNAVINQILPTVTTIFELRQLTK